MQTIKRFFSWYSDTFRKQKTGGKVAIGCVSILILFCLCSVPVLLLNPATPTPEVANTSVADVQSTPVATQTEKPTEILPPTNTPEPTSTPAPTETTIPTNTPDPNLINPGTYIVGVDIQAGIYKGFAGADLFASCYWERLKDLTGSFDSILANSNSVGQFYVEVKSSDYALKTDCEMVRLVSIPQHTGEYPQVIAAGTYLVGSDVQPGTYRGQAGSDISSSCYWERLRSVSGGFDSILANDNAIGQYYVQVLPSDFALTTACELEWVGD